jgi:hypothetical protein
MRQTCHYTFVLHQQAFMISENSNQGKFHLLAILLIPVNMLALFLMPHDYWWLSIAILIASGVLTFLVLKKTS